MADLDLIQIIAGEPALEAIIQDPRYDRQRSFPTFRIAVVVNQVGDGPFSEFRDLSGLRLNCCVMRCRQGPELGLHHPLQRVGRPVHGLRRQQPHCESSDVMTSAAWIAAVRVALLHAAVRH